MLKKHYLKEIEIKCPLKKGAKGNDVKKVQEWLNLWRYQNLLWKYNVTIDGDFGQQTQSAVIEFQKLMELEPDGIIGSQTFGILCNPLKKAFEPIAGSNIRELVVDYARQHLRNNPRELAQNSGPWVRSYMDGNEGKAWAWCMGFVQTILDMAFSTIGKKYTSCIPATFGCDEVGNHGILKNRLIRNKELRISAEIVKPGDIFLVSKTPTDWTHTGIITAIEGDSFITIEGNTNDEGSREGYEVCKRNRNFKKEKLDVFVVEKG
ncbi:MAG: hypothetical protein A2X08_10510 [Bacteroidetes bacterium GWA2_32_17]|nr:MAG: hypothetical protein A2X08_10510 [Bacteroidetes bacterium GWA2_32_17]